MDNTQYDLFFSYSRSSLGLAKMLINMLEDYGLVVWFDRTDVYLGSNILYNLNTVMKQAKKWIGMVALIDDHYLNKEWCKMEIKCALDNHITIFPILYKIEKNDVNIDFYNLKDINIVTLRNSDDIAYALNKLLDVIISRLIILEKKPINCDVFASLIYSYRNKTRLQIETIICADNIASFLEIYNKSVLSHYEKLLIKIIHTKTANLYLCGEIKPYDSKVVCHATNKLLEVFTPSELYFLLFQ